MALTIPAIVDKLLDNANAGKVVTHVMPGLALSVPLIMAINLGTNLSVLPADRAKALSEEHRQTVSALEAEQDALRPVLAQATGDRGEQLKSVSSGALYGLAEREIAGLTARLEVIDGNIKALQADRPLPRAEITKALEEKAQVASVLDPLVAQRDLVNTARERVTTAQNQVNDAASFAANIEVFTNNMSAVLAFAVILGVVLSQVSRLIFVNWWYDRRLERTSTGPVVAAMKEGSPQKEVLDELVKDYYRYVEGSINMVAPTALFGIVFPLYARARLTDIDPTFLLAVSVCSVVAAVGLAIGGYYTYAEYRKRVTELVEPKP
jgi:hypothetical protein